MAVLPMLFWWLMKNWRSMGVRRGSCYSF
jgi:hypothetical protein